LDAFEVLLSLITTFVELKANLAEFETFLAEFNTSSDKVLLQLF
jgi:hypothetical protein